MLYLTAQRDNMPPVASFTASTYNPGRDDKVTFDASGSTDTEDGTPSTYSWDCGDGSTDTGVTASYAWADFGSYTVILTVTDSAGASAETTAVINVGTAAKKVLEADGNIAVREDTFAHTSSDPLPVGWYETKAGLARMVIAIHFPADRDPDFDATNFTKAALVFSALEVPLAYPEALSACAVIGGWSESDGLDKGLCFSKVAVARAGTYEVNISDLVLLWLKRDIENWGVALIPADMGEESVTSIASRRHESKEDLTPKLVVEFLQ